MKIQDAKIKITADIKPLLNDLKQVNSELDKIRGIRKDDTIFGKVMLLVTGILIGLLIANVILQIFN
jgi:hypothetical protein